ncbi:orotate phosphoribosyltransferase [Bacillaceae bacterium W0354]
MINSKQIAHRLINIEALKVNMVDYFTWSSGIQSPIYCDNRQTISYPEVRSLIANSFIQLIEQKYPDVEVICGCATAGIPHASIIADRMNLPMIYVRNKPKAHGLKNQIEGQLTHGQKVVVVEDLISTGGSALNVVNEVREHGGVVQGVVSIFTYNLPISQEQFSSRNIPYDSLLTFDQLAEVLSEEEMLNKNELEKLINWRHSIE